MAPRVTRFNTSRLDSERLIKELADARASPEGLSVKEVGAKGDGITDDTGAFQDALAQADYVWVPQPDNFYKISDTIVVRDGKQLIGVGQHFRTNQIRCTDKTKQCVRLEGHVGFGNLSLGYTQELTASDTGAVALALSSLRRSHILPVDVFNAAYGIQILQSQGALETTAINTVFQNSFEQLDLRKCYVRYIDFRAFNSANTANIFHNVRCVGFSSGTSRLTMAQAIELAANTGIVFGILNIEHTIFDTAVFRATSGNAISIAELHMEGLSFDNNATTLPVLALPVDMHCSIGAWKLWNNPTNPTTTEDGTIAYLFRLRQNSVLQVGQFYSGGVTRNGSSDMRWASYASAAVSNAYARFGQATRTGITTTLDEDASLDTSGLAMGRLYTIGQEVVYLRERSAAEKDREAHGQFWVKDDTPNVPRFTDDAGNDFGLVAENLATEQALLRKDLAHRGEAGNKLAFETGLQRFYIGSAEKWRLSADGITLFDAIGANAQIISGHYTSVETKSGALAGADSGKLIVTSGAVTVPANTNWAALIRLGGDHDIDFGALGTLDVSALNWAAGDLITFIVTSTTTFIATRTAAMDIIDETDLY